MLSFLPGTVRGILAAIFLIFNLSFWLTLLLPFSIIKILCPIRTVRKPTNFMLNFFCTCWASCNKLFLMLLNDTQWDIKGDQNLSMKEWYLVLSNHQSWADIVVLQFVLNNRIPYFRFFLKRELVWLPVFNFVWYALDYPFMKRYSKDFIRNNPHLKGKDLETTKKSCERFKDVPVAVMSFAEGTRFRPEKHKKQQSPFRHLLKPRAGGIAFVLSAMGDQLTSILDVTISYEPEAKGLWDFLCGRVSCVKVRINQIPITNDIIGDYFDDHRFRQDFQKWVNRIWTDKDNILEGLRNT